MEGLRWAGDAGPCSAVNELLDERGGRDLTVAAQFFRFITLSWSWSDLVQGVSLIRSSRVLTSSKKLLMDKEAYNSFVLALDQVKMQNNVRDELRMEMLQLARENLEKEPQIMELRNQCQIIRTIESAQEKFRELRKQQEEMLKHYLSAALLHKLHEAMIKTEEEFEALHQQLLDREIELGAFVQKYKKLRASYHCRALTHLAAKTSPIL